ncbi:MAG: DUF72 domain-containing protein [Planctomycetes bacterium]|nr:DUF72 domain-containing protein [Planctomycetota bacterium]
MSKVDPMAGALHFGTSSWSEKAWDGVFYPSGLAPAEQLPFYATQFGTVEADVTYYRVPDRRLVSGWAERTPEGFVISAKFPRSIVHGGSEAAPDGAKVLVREHIQRDLERFLEAMSLLGEKCGPLVMQFPYFNRGAFATVGVFRERLDAFLATLPKQFCYAVELRNKSWIDAQTLALLQSHGCALVLVDLVYMPHPCELAERFDLLTADFTYARLIGDRKRIDSLTDTLDRVVLDQSERLDHWAGLIRELLSRAKDVYVYANNHYAGFAPDTIRDLVARVGAPQGGPPAP